ncbi:MULTISPECIES: copper resistance CopC/CopD family protein [unclassified Nocardioides]|uniref:copper resistance CopC/CopD family protein n=1 Tax=unclassified Nocardioides TaxID=2615069 RepID=UPI0006FDD3E4|nr:MULTISPECIES: copper resistance protein CopC [unclassified Nocardioides]KRA39085.1 hypothetical protein ASD81_11080 [Nocardioides sp. Root614]KRA93044.1 hypothetical protein ASD84_11345 [Nocardioides sp. Root682]
MSRFAAALACVVLTVLSVVGTASPAAAHASLVSSDPAEGAVLPRTPDVVTFTFDEAVSLTAGGVRVFDATGIEVTAAAASQDAVISVDLPDRLPDGSYVVVWRAVSADGHPIAGSLTFAVGAASPEVVPPTLRDDDVAGIGSMVAVLQALDYVGLLVAGGVLLFLLWVLAGITVPAAVHASLLAVARGAVRLAVLSAVLLVPLQAAHLQGVGLDRLADLDLLSNDTVVAGLQAAGLVAALAFARSGARWAASVAVLLAGVSPVLVGHSRSVEPVVVMLLTDVVHVMAGLVWLGGLIALAMVLGPLRGRARDTGLVLSRFSGLAAGSVVLLAASGMLMAWRILGAWQPLVDTAYGRLLLGKIGVAAVVVAVAAWNRFRLLPPVLAPGEGAGPVSGSVRVAVRVEAALLVLLLALTGLLTQHSPRERSATAAPSRGATAVVTPDLNLHATISPGRRGPNTITVHLRDGAGGPVVPRALPDISLHSMDVHLGSQPVVAGAPGTYVVTAVLPTSGTWTFQVGVRMSRFENPVATLELEVS